MLRLRFAAISDVGRVRKDNQDAGYAGPWLLTVCDGVGGAARGDIASSTAVQQLRRLDEEPPTEHTPDDLLTEVSGALVRAHDRIGELVDQDPALDGTSTTAVVARFDGSRIGIGHVGDSRAYLYREGELTQLTHDHTFVQSLIDEGRITEDEARVHPHRNLILRALDGVRDVDPDLFVVELAPGDRLMLCSDGVCGSLADPRLADILATGSPDYAAVELVRAALEAGSSDNVTCVVADVVPEEEADDEPDESDSQSRSHDSEQYDEIDELEPLLVGAAAELRRKHPGGRRMFRGHRSGDTGELEPITAELGDDEFTPPPGAIPADPDPEAYRYAPRAPDRFRWLTRLLVACVVVGVIWVAAAGAWTWAQKQFYVGEDDGTVVIFRGLDTEFAGVALSEPYETTDITLDELSEFDADKVRSGMPADDVDDARNSVDALAERVVPTTADTGSDTSSSASPSPTSSPTSPGDRDDQTDQDTTP